MRRPSLLAFAAAVSLTLAGCDNILSFIDEKFGKKQGAADTTAPAEVGSLAVSASSGQVTITWSDPTDSDLAYVVVSRSGIAERLFVPGIGTFTEAGLVDGTTYTYLLRTQDKAGNRSSGRQVQATPTGVAAGPDLLPPGEVSGLSPALASEKVVLGWTDPPDPDFDHVLVLRDGVEELTVAKGVESASFSGLLNNRTYSFLVRTADGSGNLSGGVTASATPRGSWTARGAAGSRPWYVVASSTDGQRLTAASNPGNLYASSDGGATWAALSGAGSRAWYGLASSADGATIVAAVDTGNLWVSSDHGATWAERTVAHSGLWTGTAASGDGQFLAAGTWGGYVFTSADGGATWTQRTSLGTGQWVDLAISKDGSALYVVDTSPGYVSVSTDQGATWSALASAGSKDWYGVACSADGSFVAVLDKVNGAILTSADRGVTWTERTGAGTRHWYSLAVSEDGKVLAAGTFDAAVHVSIDGGDAWTEETALGNGSWVSVGVSGNGSRLVAVDFITAGFAYSTGALATKQ